ncbi:MAG: hypothetical protein J0H40_17455 [Rhizobiales bacterium]|nr:hypothetical protein [Hyphomicrobiales bacterium]
MTQVEPTRVLSLEEIDEVGGGGAVLGSATSSLGDEYGTVPSGAESLQNTYVVTRPLPPAISATLFHL